MSCHADHRLRNLNFAYPGSDEGSSQCLKDVSLTIPAGSIVVLVGTNGSGKSTLIKLLSGLYNPDSGIILIDGHPSKSYSGSALRQTSVILAQDHRLFPLSFAENIGLGWVPSIGDLDAIRDAANKGGARGFIEKYEEGFQTTLNPFLDTTINLVEGPDHPLEILRKGLKKKIDVSGGEKQRVVA